MAPHRSRMTWNDKFLGTNNILVPFSEVADHMKWKNNEVMVAKRKIDRNTYRRSLHYWVLYGTSQHQVPKKILMNASRYETLYMLPGSGEDAYHGWNIQRISLESAVIGQLTSCIWRYISYTPVSSILEIWNYYPRHIPRSWLFRPLGTYTCVIYFRMLQSYTGYFC